VHTVVETPAYLRAAKESGMTVAEMARAVDLLAANPQSGAMIVGTGGCRKVRIAKERRGKSGGYRVITFFGGDDIPVFLVTVFGKNEKADLSGAERNALAKMTAVIAAEYRRI
jgi:hypothetical protein